MKTIKLLFMMLTIVSLITGCSKDDLVSNQDDDLMLKKAPLSPVFVVEPNGTDDTENLKNAFADAQAAGPGAIVQLCEGEYHLGLLQVYGFEGCLRGAGKDKTIITALNNLDIQSLWDQNLRGDLVKFVGGDVHLSQFTVQTPPGKIAVSGTNGPISTLFNFSSGNAVVPANENSFINVEIDNVRFHGQILEGGFAGSNCAFGVRAGYDWFTPINLPRGKVNLKVTNSEFDKFMYGLIMQSLTNSKIILGENGHGNVFNNSLYSSGIFESRDMKILIQGNTINIPYASYGINLDINTPHSSDMFAEEPQTKATVCIVQNNTFIMSKAYNGLWMIDYRRRTNPEELPVVFQVKSNRFQLSEGWGRAMRCRWTKGTVIRNNKIEGYGSWGIQIDSPGGDVYNENGLLLGNNFANADLKNGSVLLSADTKNWTVVGGNLGETVVDDGVNNIITGFNNQTLEEPLGQTIVDNLDEIHSVLWSIK